MAETWISRPDLEALIGRDAADTLCRTHGGVALYVPRLPDTEGQTGQTGTAGKLARLIGKQALQTLCAIYGGEMVTVPNGRRPAPAKGRIITRLEEGKPHSAIAMELGVTERHVREIAARIRPRVKQGSLL